MATEADHQMNVTRNLQDISPTFLSQKYAKRYQKYKNKEKILSSYEADLFVSSLPVQLDNVDQYYYYYEDDVIKKAIPKKFPLKSTSLQNSHIQSKSTFPFSTYCGCCCCCCDCCHTPTQNNHNNNNSNINSHNDNIDDGYSSTIKKCFSSTKFQHILHHVILILLAISTALSILLLLLGIFLNCRACLTTGCILGIASFGALLHGCLRHRSLPNSSMPIMLSASCIIYPPIGDHLSLTPNRFLRKHSSPEYFQQLQQQQQQQKYRGHQYRLKTIDNPHHYYYYHCNNNSKSKSNNSCHCTKT
ncbi:unnamed protein product [Trichobilharzia szidati]|nr:unnamed protein product [Trichobilharzia szidati]